MSPGGFAPPPMMMSPMLSPIKVGACTCLQHDGFLGPTTLHGRKSLRGLVLSAQVMKSRQGEVPCMEVGGTTYFAGPGSHLPLPMGPFNAAWGPAGELLSPRSAI